MNEQTPLLQNNKACCSTDLKNSCCSVGLKKKSCCSSKDPTDELPTTTGNEEHCFLSQQKWEYKSIALLCALFLAGNEKNTS